MPGFFLLGFLDDIMINWGYWRRRGIYRIV